MLSRLEQHAIRANAVQQCWAGPARACWLGNKHDCTISFLHTAQRLKPHTHTHEGERLPTCLICHLKQFQCRNTEKKLKAHDFVCPLPAQINQRQIAETYIRLT